VPSRVFRQYIVCHKEESEALTVLLDRLNGKRLSRVQLEELAAVAVNDNSFWSLKNLWQLFYGKGHSPGQFTAPSCDCNSKRPRQFVFNLRIGMEDLAGERSTTHGGLSRAKDLFGNELLPLLSGMSNSPY